MGDAWWSMMCSTRFLLVLNTFLQILQSHLTLLLTFLPLHTSRCFLKFASLYVENVFLQWMHETPEVVTWLVMICLWRLSFLLNFLSHVSQFKIDSPWTLATCFDNPFLFGNFFSHWTHLKWSYYAPYYLDIYRKYFFDLK